jgi:hypothetical protein
MTITTVTPTNQSAADPRAPHGFTPEQDGVHQGPYTPTHTALGTIYSSWHAQDGLILNVAGEDLTLAEARRVVVALAALIGAVERAVS